MSLKEGVGATENGNELYWRGRICDACGSVVMRTQVHLDWHAANDKSLTGGQLLRAAQLVRAGHPRPSMAQTVPEYTISEAIHRLADALEKIADEAAGEGVR